MRDRLDHYPLRQLVHAHGALQRAFAGGGMVDRLSRDGRYRIASHGAGATVFAASELALAEAQLVLRQACHDAVAFGDAIVHTYVDDASGRVMAPVMFLRVDAPRPHGRALLRALAERGIEPQEVESQRTRMVIRAEVPLARLLGVERMIGELTDGSAHTMCWLLRYDAVMPGVLQAAVAS